MKPRLATRSWLVAAWILIALLSGSATVTSVRLLSEAAGFLVLPGVAPRVSGPKGREADVTELVATRDRTGGALGLVRQTIAPRSGPPTHIHEGEDEFFYVVSGEFKVKLGDRIMSAPAQSVLFVPRGTAHTFQNVGAAPGVLLVGVTPGGFEKMFEERQGVDAETNRALMTKVQDESGGTAAPVTTPRPLSDVGVDANEPLPPGGMLVEARKEDAVNEKKPLTTFAHPVPELPVVDVERAQQHYRDALGFEIGWLYPGKEIGAVSRGEAVIFLRRRNQPFEPAVHWVFAGDIDATYDELQSSGSKIVEPLEKKPWGLRQFTVEDLDGNRFYFHCD